MTDLLTAFGLLALAELGDKTQLLALAFATRYRAWHVLVGIAVAATVVLGAAALLGGVLGEALPARGLAIAAGSVFLGFAVWTWRDDDGEDGEDGNEDGEDRAGPGGVRVARSALVTVTAAFVLAELGDKTMVAAAALAATRDPLPVWVGAVAGMTLAGGVAIVVGRLLGRHLPADRLRLLAALAFAVFGVLLLVEGLTG